ncbi:EcsC family protein [Neobacillus thermocopriae]|uniref:EcsC family protein n=1 Tax=Neobacillus thermocopriae TaxID=1215031 RepID=A0A6B3TXJ1_9BACI|nr:EcsC family protein [Neobacillus thermocopriae]MED3623044.1 EcsC family protein [Neobacillus thermocopriae]MED3714939.1 EcsC family protein [Neobacillus thermocopriae]NEX80347.1 EcsC family protein [Neobacillus thermocopriae]
MNEYELKVFDEIEDWKRKITRRSGMMNRVSKKAQEKINEFIPEKVHELMTESIKGMVKATLFGSQLTTNRKQAIGLSLEERDELVRIKISSFQKTAIIEGAGTGAGGILLGLADFPLLLTIKMKFLFEAAAIYGFDTKEYEERLFLLHVFQLAFSSDEIRRNTLAVIENWEQRKKELVEMDWRKFQQEYRDYIDFVKMLQLVPGIGAFVGAYANNNLLKTLGETAMNAYRLRILQKAQ